MRQGAISVTYMYTVSGNHMTKTQSYRWNAANSRHAHTYSKYESKKCVFSLCQGTSINSVEKVMFTYYI